MNCLQILQDLQVIRYLFIVYSYIIIYLLSWHCQVVVDIPPPGCQVLPLANHLCGMEDVPAARTIRVAFSVAGFPTVVIAHLERHQDIANGGAHCSGC